MLPLLTMAWPWRCDSIGGDRRPEKKSLASVFFPACMPQAGEKGYAYE